LLTNITGCTRPFFRNRADNEVGEILAQKDKYPDWKIDNWHVYPDPRSRFADPTNPDHPPKPPDDPAAYDLSPNPQKAKKVGIARIEGTGYLELIAQWDRENRERQAQQDAEEKRQSVEPPSAGEEQETRQAAVERGATVTRRLDGVTAIHLTPRIRKLTGASGTQKPDEGRKPPNQEDAIVAAKTPSLLDVTGRPTYLMTLDQAAELAMFNSREYQDQRESLYLAALPVTEERFSFMGQAFVAGEAIRSYAGSHSTDGKTNNWSLNNGVGLSKVLPTGALLLFNFSNQTVFDFLNPKKTTSLSTLNFNAIQPLLRGGGQAVALESLTLAERNLLYAIRNFARFRKELYVEIASSNGGAINGSAFQPTGVLSSNSGGGAGFGSTGLIPGVIPAASTTRIGGPIFPGSPAGQIVLTRALTPPPSGYLNTMLQKIQVLIDLENIDVLTDILQRFRGLLEGDVVAPLQVQSVEQQLLAGRSTLLNDQQQYLQSLDSFKIEIGVPMQLSIQMDDSVLLPLLKQFRRARAITDNEKVAVRAASALIPVEKAPTLRPDLLRLFEKTPLVQGTPFARTIRGRFAEWDRSKLTDKELTDRLDALRKDAQKILDLQTELEKKGQPLSDADQARLKQLSGLRDMGNLEVALRIYEAAYVDRGMPKKPDTPAGERQRIRQFQSVVSSWQKVLVEARDDQWMAVHKTWPDLPRCCVDGVDLVKDDLGRAQDVGGRHALLNRLDLMNTRAQVVDAWRQIAVYANALLGFFNVQYQLTGTSPATVAQPLNIGGSRTGHQLILNGTLPLVRIQERNNYRASQIAFQRQRRSLQEAEDLAIKAVNQQLFVLRQYAESYRVQKRQLELAYLTIDSSLESLEAPTAPPAPPGQTASRGADGPAALTQQLLSAQRTLPTSQNALLTTWITYLDARLQLYRDLELMPLDARGVWIDEVRDCDCGILDGSTPPGKEELLPMPDRVKPAPSQEIKDTPAGISQVSVKVGSIATR
jgi:hypothetical protein